MSVAEILGTVFALLCVGFTVRQNIWCWPTGILNNIFFIVLFVKDRLYADLALQVIYIALGFYGWWMWLYGGKRRSRLPVSRTPAFLLWSLAAVFVVATFLLARALNKAAVLMGVPGPDFVYWDSATTVACLIAQWMLGNKLIENWPVWIATNVSYIGLYSLKHRYLLSALQVVFIVLSVIGYLRWKRELMHRQQDSSLASSCPRTEGISS
ncbi:MAG TPA: nicotinamide riboside transporter PnuC [Blastocatellia bacterium]|nr:nicotinamide riboside transporter PnuC [Blastocatellia bacterium]